ncbi:MAG: bifunctional nuclease family protein [Planctomyces sp.]|nr:bifunctional nuclease family protein [Planctomyces sp.]
MSVRMELSRIVDCDLNDQHWVHLTEAGGTRSLQIVIGQTEAAAINRRLLDSPPFRPLTHQLICNIVEALQGHFEELMISSLKDHTYYATLKIRVGDEVIPIDCRPSDGLAIAVHHSPILPIYVEEAVLQAAGS